MKHLYRLFAMYIIAFVINVGYVFKNTPTMLWGEDASYMWLALVLGSMPFALMLFAVYGLVVFIHYLWRKES